MAQSEIFNDFKKMNSAARSIDEAGVNSLPLFKASGVHKRFGNHVVLENINLQFESDCLSGIMGPNGAGKTTCFNVLTGKFKPDRGRIEFLGEDITGIPPHEIARKGIARSFQTMNLFNEFSVLENILIALKEVRMRGFDFVHLLARESEVADKAETILARIGLSGKENHRTSELAYGDRRSLEIGVALAAEPSLLFLDEPTSGLGAKATMRLLDLMHRLKDNYTIVMIEHDMKFLFELADSISVIHWGQVIAQGTPDTLRANKWVKQSMLGEDG